MLHYSILHFKVLHPNSIEPTQSWSTFLSLNHGHYREVNSKAVCSILNAFCFVLTYKIKSGVKEKNVTEEIKRYTFRYANGLLVHPNIMEVKLLNERLHKGGLKRKEPLD